MDLGLVTASVPIFVGLILLEIIVGRLQGRHFYRLNDTISDLAAGAGQQVFALPINLLFVAVYATFSSSIALTHWEVSSPWEWVLLFVAIDFCYYWFHRASHRVNFLWAAHVVHHQSEEYNLAVALRQSWLQEAFSVFFYLPLALLGVPTQAMLAVVAANTVGQFWIHTRAIGRLGPLEWVLNTPSHHRVHHGRNPKYLDRNYAGVLIIWDRMFGSLQLEEDEPVYGIVKPLASWNVAWANVHYWVDLARMKSLSAWLLPPEKTGSPPPEVSAESVTKYDAAPSAWAQRYAFALLLFGLAALKLLMEYRISWSLPVQVSVAGIVLWTLVNAGGCMESRSWARVSEAARWAAVAVTGAAMWMTS